MAIIDDRTSENETADKRRGATNQFPILSKINSILIPQQGIRMRAGSPLLYQPHNQPRQIRNMHITPTTLPPPNLHSMTMPQRLPRQIRNLYTAFVTRPPSQPINQRSVHDCRPDAGLGGGEVQEEVIDGTLGGGGYDVSDFVDALEVVVVLLWAGLSVGLRCDVWAGEEACAGDLDPDCVVRAEL